MQTEKQLINIEIDHDQIETIILENIQQHLSNIDNNKLFYTMEDLQEITGMSKGFIEIRFFHDPRFEKIRRKVGRKWLFPVSQTRSFLNEWINEQPND
ncbi:hypothetical protein SAMN04488569_102022 [Marinilactibacillus piezotolerans]|uniref:Uncharacterized protein n=1 Tax=Marinilactibacillus piezotolerans TaxID=258723 RepID=A0A1I3Y935_9LACT|nr:hypothetical protein [Marinilactibacillus piezotolerans]SFK28368.1 hypothetical protein SAMN04488569_102022 [Marinilactibacillus piezotolerans]